MATEAQKKCINHKYPCPNNATDGITAKHNRGEAYFDAEHGACPGGVAISCNKCGHLSCWWCGGHASPNRTPMPNYPRVPR